MTLIVGSKGIDGVFLSADRRHLSKHERGPDISKLFKLSCGVAIAGAGDAAVLNEARTLINRQAEELQAQGSASTLLEIVEIAAAVVNGLADRYHGTVEEPFGFALGGLENLNSGTAKIYTVFGSGFSEVPWVCIGLGGSYARPFADLLFNNGDLKCEDAKRLIPVVFTMVSNVQTSVGGGVDICIIKNEEEIGQIRHNDEISLKSLRLAILNYFGIAT